jgi:hypothetical protein
MIRSWLRFLFSLLSSPHWRCSGCGEIMRLREGRYICSLPDNRTEWYCDDCCTNELEHARAAVEEKP